MVREWFLVSVSVQNSIGFIRYWVICAAIVWDRLFRTFRDARTVEAGSGASYYWAGKEPATQWFAAVPFGMNAQGMGAWFHGGDGLKLWEETYAPFNLVPRPGGSTGVQMGGWFNKKINTIDDYKGLKMRIPGLGGKVVAKAGGTVVLLPGGEQVMAWVYYWNRPGIRGTLIASGDFRDRDE